MISQMTCRLAEEMHVPVYRLNTVILGAGAAGMNCAVHLFEFFTARGVTDAQDRLAVVTAGLGLGASRMSGSDKQTYYKLGTSPGVPDSAIEFAKTLTAHGCMHGDIALAEAASSLREFSHLVQAGVPFPHDAEGAFIGYKTDHDPRERATSVGPKTSLFMSECLQKQVEKYGIRIFDKQEAVHLLVRSLRRERRIVGLVTLDKTRLGQPDFGLTVFLCENIVLAAGGPGALYEVSVYPRGQVGIHGLAFKAGLKAHNMAEWQFGLASTRFRWNVSGTYMQVVPRIISTDTDGGNEREFLNPHFPSMSRMATCIFLKGYQWPFDAQRVLNHQSSLIDLLVTHETRALRRRVFMDFLRNPFPGRGMAPFALHELEPEALTYLQRNGALQDTPIQRLNHMNPQAIEVYREHDIDLTKEPLEINVCAQHHNGGFVVNKWWESQIRHSFVIGEMAGTHGVKRPGGSALNAGQVGGLRAAEYIAAVYGTETADEALLGDQERACLGELIAKLQNLMQGASGSASPRDALTAIQRRSSETAGHLRSLAGAERGLSEARQSLSDIAKNGLRVTGREDLILAIQVEHMALTQVALLEALADYLRRGGGSRGSYMVLREGGAVIEEDLIDPQSRAPYAFIPENEALREDVTELALADPEGIAFQLRQVPVRPMPERDTPFEVMWSAYRAGTIYTE